MTNKRMAVIAVILVCGLSFGFAGWNVWHAREQLAQAKIEVEMHTNDDVNATATQVPEQVQSAINEVTGLNTQRVSRDKRLFEEFCRTIFAWTDGKGYQDARNYCIETGIPEDGPFLTQFFSPINWDGTGPDPLTRDSGAPLNLHYGSMSQKVTDVQDGVYSYLSIVTLTSDISYRDAEGNVHQSVGRANALMTYQIDADGTISNLDATVIDSL